MAPMRTARISLALVLALAGGAAAEPLLLVVDAPAGTPDHLSRFRTMDAAFPADTARPPSREGLAGLHASGSSEFSVAGLAMLRARLPVERFTVVDLREESHGYVAGLPVSWEANHNWANVGKSSAEVRADEEQRLAALARRERVTLTRMNARWGRDGVTSWTVRPRETMTEEQLVRAHGLGYERFTVSDHTYPNDADTDRFVQLAKQELRSGWLHFHCKAGIGRTTVFLAMADMIANAPRVSRDDILRRQRLLGGFDTEEVKPSGDWHEETARKRRDFLYAFYDYCRAAPPVTWSEYARARRASAATSTAGSASPTSAR